MMMIVRILHTQSKIYQKKGKIQLGRTATRATALDMNNNVMAYSASSMVACGALQTCNMTRLPMLLQEGPALCCSFRSL